MQALWVDGFDQRVLLSRFVHLVNTGGLVVFDGEAKTFVPLARDRFIAFRRYIDQATQVS